MYGGYDGSATQFAGNGGGFMATPTGATDAATGAAGGGSLSSHPLSWHRPMSRLKDVVPETLTGRPRRSMRGVFAPGHPPRFVQIFPFPGLHPDFFPPSPPLLPAARPGSPRFARPRDGQDAPDCDRRVQRGAFTNRFFPRINRRAPSNPRFQTCDFKPAQLCF